MLISQLIAGIAAKLAGLGLAAKAGLGVTVAAASVGTAGAAGVLPVPVQNAVATTVGVATPFTFPDSAGDHDNFGATVSADATGASDGTPGVDGQVVSEAAHDKKHSDSQEHPKGVGANSGATGLDRANQTPAAGHVRTSVPTGDDADEHDSSIDDDADDPDSSIKDDDDATGDHTHSRSHSSDELDDDDSTPAGGHTPAHGPGRR